MELVQHCAAPPGLNTDRPSEDVIVCLLALRLTWEGRKAPVGEQ